MLDDTIGRNRYDSILISGLAELGVNPNEGWHSPSNYTPILAVVIQLARIMVVEYGFQETEDEWSSV